MAYLEYLLLALLGSTGGGAAAGVPSRTLDASAIEQPRGGTMIESAPGAMVLGQDTGGDKAKSTTGKKPVKTTRRRTHKGHQRRHKPAADSGKKGH